MPDCTHERTIRVSGKCSDQCWTVWPDGTTKDGYAPLHRRARRRGRREDRS